MTLEEIVQARFGEMLLAIAKQEVLINQLQREIEALKTRVDVTEGS